MLVETAPVPPAAIPRRTRATGVIDPDGGSRTALGVAALRAAHLLLDDPPPILEDRIALPLLGPGAETGIREHADRFRTPASLGLRSHVLLRSRFAEDCLLDAVARGTDQYVILGAGLDTFAYRQPANVGGLRIFEVDLPPTQASKRRRLAAAGIDAPPNLAYVPADLTDPGLLEVLAAAGLDLGRPLVGAILGVTVYLPPAAVQRLHEMLAGLAAGSDIVMTFAHPAVPGGEDALANAAAAAGEPWRTRTTREDLLSDLDAAGFASVEVLESFDAWQRYFRDRTDALRPSPRANLIRATTGARRPSALMPPSENGA